MSNNQKTEMIDRVDRFLRKEMTESESRAFIEDVNRDPELRECYQIQFNLMRGVKFQNLTELMKEKEAELSTGRPEPIPWWKVVLKGITSSPVDVIQSGGTVVTRRFRYAYAAVAVAAAMVCGVFIRDGYVTRSVGADELELVVMRGYDSIDDLIKDKHYEEALREIDKELNKPYDLGDDPGAKAAHDEDMNELKYKKALVYLAMGKKNKAKAIIKELDDEKYKEVLKRLLW